MKLYDVVSLLEVKEAQARAYCAYLNSKNVDYDLMQKCIDNYIDNMLESFIEEHKGVILEDDKFRKEIRKYLLSISADKQYGDKRLFKAFYKKLNRYEETLANQDELAM